jgi:hypothetical protein
MSPHGSGVRGAWLSDRLLLLASGRDQLSAAKPATARVAGRSVPLEVEGFDGAANTAAGGRPGPSVVVCRLTEALDPLDRSPLSLQFGERTISFAPAEPGTTETDLSALVRTELAGYDARTRAQVLEFILSRAAPEIEAPGGVSVGRKLMLIRDVLRERLPLVSVQEEEPLGAHIDDIFAVDETSFWVKGWVFNVDKVADRVVLVSPEGSRVEVTDRAFRYRRWDIEQLYRRPRPEHLDTGFLAHLRIDAPSRLSLGWVGEVTGPAGTGVEVEGPPVVQKPVTVRDGIVRDTGEVTRARDKLIIEHAHPALSRVLERMAGFAAIEDVTQYGDPPASPRESIVVGLGDRFDVLENQLASFRADPDIAGADLIYVQDHPDSAEALSNIAAELAWLYELPFRLVTLSGRVQPTTMLNLGIEEARGSRLVLLSADALPLRPGWLRTMSSFYDETPGIGALGPKLLYEDGSLQHAGIHYERFAPQELGSCGHPTIPVWQPRHRFKGLPASFAAANEAAQVPAVESACLMIDREFFEQLGGLRNIYIEGERDGEDLCLRAIEAGRENWYLPDVALSHLEGRSQIELDANGTQYNMLLHSHLWGELIPGLI